MSREPRAHPVLHAYAVATQGLSKRYAGKMALDRVDLRVPDGAVYVLIGANGAGKSTTLRLLMNLEQPDAGTVEVLGLHAGVRGPEVRAQVGYVPERDDAGYRWMACGHLLRHIAAYYPTWDHVYAHHLTRALGLELGRTVGSLSKGAVRRLQFVLALAHRPHILLLDEPTDGLDPMVRKRVLTLLTEHLADSPATVLMSTHQLHEVESLADHIGVLHNGRLVAQMSREELQRTVRRYRIEVPERWKPPTELHIADLRRSSAGREIRVTLVGEEAEVAERLVITGARVHEVTPLRLEDAALALFPNEDLL